MPSGRDIYTSRPWSCPALDAQALASMRAPPDSEQLARLKSEVEAESDNEDGAADLPGAFPGSAADDTRYY